MIKCLRRQFYGAFVYATSIDCNAFDINAPFCLHIVRLYNKISILRYICRIDYNNHHTVRLLDHMFSFEFLVHQRDKKRLTYFINYVTENNIIYHDMPWYMIWAQWYGPYRMDHVIWRIWNFWNFPSSSLLDLLRIRRPSLQFGEQVELQSLHWVHSHVCEQGLSFFKISNSIWTKKFFNA